MTGRPAKKRAKPDDWGGREATRQAVLAADRALHELRLILLYGGLPPFVAGMSPAERRVVADRCRAAAVMLAAIPAVDGPGRTMREVLAGHPPLYPLHPAAAVPDPEDRPCRPPA